MWIVPVSILATFAASLLGAVLDHDFEYAVFKTQIIFPMMTMGGFIMYQIVKLNQKLNQDPDKKPDEE